MTALPLYKRIILLSFISIATISAAIITPALPQIAQTFHVSLLASSHLVGVFLLGYVLGQLIYGPLANRMGRLKALRAGLVLNLLGLGCSLLAVSMVSYPLLLASRFITALGAASGLCCTVLLIKELNTHHHAKALNAYAVLSFTFGIGLAVWLGGYLCQQGLWAGCFVFLLGHGALMWGLSFLFEEPMQAAKVLPVRTLTRNFTRVLANTRMLFFGLIVGLPTLFSYTYGAMAPLYSHLSLGLSPEGYGTFNLLTLVGMLCGSLLGVQLQSRIGPKATLRLGLVLFLPLLLGLVAIDMASHVHPLLFFINCAGFYMNTGLLFPTGTHFAMETTDDAASGASVVSFINMSTAALGIFICGMLSFSPLTNLIITVGGCFAFIVCFGFLLECLPWVILIRLRSE